MACAAFMLVMDMMPSRRSAKCFPLQLVPGEKTSDADDASRLSHQPGLISVHRSPIIFRLSSSSYAMGSCAPSPITAPLLKSGERREWRTARVVLQSAAELLQDQRYPPVRRLVHVLQFASLLDKAKTRSLDDAKVSSWSAH